MTKHIDYQDETVMLQEFVVDEHILVRPIVVDDSERIFEIIEADGDIRDHVGLFADCDTLERLKEKLADQIAHGALRHAISLDGVLVGYIGIHQDPDEDKFVQYIISDFLASEFRGQGIMGKSLEVLLREAEKSLKIDRFSAWVEEGNPASANVLKRLGFQHTNIPHTDGKGRTNWDYIREVNNA
jgi:RimJ/RimL family protein N-acetyltransferase